MEKTPEIIQRLKEELRIQTDRADRLECIVKEKDEKIFSLEKILQTTQDALVTAKKNAVILFSQYKNIAE